MMTSELKKELILDSVNNSSEPKIVKRLQYLPLCLHVKFFWGEMEKAQKDFLFLSKYYIPSNILAMGHHDDHETRV